MNPKQLLDALGALTYNGMGTKFSRPPSTDDMEAATLPASWPVYGSFEGQPASFTADFFLATTHSASLIAAVELVGNDNYPADYDAILDTLENIKAVIPNLVLPAVTLAGLSGRVTDVRASDGKAYWAAVVTITVTG